MRSRFRTALVSTAALALVLASVGLAAADDVVVGPDATKSPGSSGTFSVYLAQESGGGDFPNCNVDADHPATVSFASTNTAVVAAPASVQLAACGVGSAATVNYQVAAGATDGATSTITASAVGGKANPNFTSTFDPDSFVVTVDVTDTTAPVITPHVVGTSGDNGWYKSNVAVSWSVVDEESAITDSSGCGAVTLSADSAGTTYTCTATSAGGTASESVTVKRDATAPAIDCGTADGTWHRSNVSIPCTAGGGVSGLADPAQAAFSLVTSVDSGEETNNAATDSAAVSDGAGNSSTAGPISGNMIDRKAPTVSCGSADLAWHGDEVTVACTASDGGSGLASGADASFTLTTSVGENAENAAANTSTRRVEDAVGNFSTAGPVSDNKVDRKAPVVSCGSDDGSWHNANVTIICTATDGGSGLADPADASFTLSTTVPDGEETASASTNSRTVLDLMGNQVTVGPLTGIKVDRKVPAISCGSADGVWHRDNVSVACSAEDQGSGLAFAGDGSFSLSTTVPEGSETNDASTSSHNVSDVAGNVATAGPITGNKVDRKAPVVLCDDADPVWHNDNISLSCAAEDGGSGLASTSSATFSLSTGVAAGFEDGNASTDSRSVADAVGNSVTAGPIAGNKVDRKAPVVSCGSDDGSWHNANVTITCTATDGGSGLADPADASFTLSTTVPDGEETASASTNSRTVLDLMGNQVTVGPLTGIKVDRKVPAISCGSADGVWHRDNVSVACSAEDQGSGLAFVGDGSFSLWTDVPEGTETDDASTSSHNVSDLAGNVAAAGPIGGNMIDRRAPEFSCGLADLAWHDDNVTVACTASDGGSGLASGADAAFSLSTGVADGFEDGNASTDSRSVADAVGNSVTAGPIADNKVDRKAPVVSCGSDDGSWHNANVTITCTATDGGSDLADPADASFTLSTSVAAGDEDGNASTDSHDVFDAVSNRATAGPITGIKVDRKAPTLTWSAGAGESFHFGAALTAPTCSAVDNGSGVPDGCSVSGFSTAVGTHTLVASATDVAGNLATETRIYTVLPWTLEGYYQPVNMAALNTVKAGSTVPLKFNVRRAGQTITDPAVLGAQFTVVRTACPNEPLDPFEGFLSSGGTTLRYDPIGGQWIQNWATPKAAVGTCWEVTMTAADGSSITADFKLK